MAIGIKPPPLTPPPASANIPLRGNFAGGGEGSSGGWGAFAPPTPSPLPPSPPRIPNRQVAVSGEGEGGEGEGDGEGTPSFDSAVTSGSCSHRLEHDPHAKGGTVHEVAA